MRTLRGKLVAFLHSSAYLPFGKDGRSAARYKLFYCISRCRRQRRKMSPENLHNKSVEQHTTARHFTVCELQANFSPVDICRKICRDTGTPSQTHSRAASCARCYLVDTSTASSVADLAASQLGAPSPLVGLATVAAACKKVGSTDFFLTVRLANPLSISSTMPS